MCTEYKHIARMPRRQGRKARWRRRFFGFKFGVFCLQLLVQDRSREVDVAGTKQHCGFARSDDNLCMSAGSRHHGRELL